MIKIRDLLGSKRTKIGVNVRRIYVVPDLVKEPIKPDQSLTLTMNTNMGPGRGVSEIRVDGRARVFSTIADPLGLRVEVNLHYGDQEIDIFVY